MSDFIEIWEDIIIDIMQYYSIQSLFFPILFTIPTNIHPNQPIFIRQIKNHRKKVKFSFGKCLVVFLKQKKYKLKKGISKRGKGGEGRGRGGGGKYSNGARGHGCYAKELFNSSVLQEFILFRVWGEMEGGKEGNGEEEKLLTLSRTVWQICSVYG